MKKSLMISLFAVGTILVGCSQQQSASHSASSSAQSSSVQATPQIKVNEHDAAVQLTKAYPDAHLTGLELGLQGSTYEYKLEGQTATQEVTVIVDATTGKKRHQAAETLEADDKEAALKLSDVISRQAAGKLAVAQVGAGVAREWQLSSEDGRVTWEVQVHDGTKQTEVTVDAHSSEILKVDHDD